MTAFQRAVKAAFVALTVISFSPALQAEPEFSLKLHHQLGPKAPAHSKMLVPWAERIEKDTNGRVKIEIYPSMSLGGKPTEVYGQVRDGVVDLAWVANGYTAGLFPRSEVFELPFIHTNNLVATNLAMADLYDDYLKAEYQDVHVLFMHVHAGQAIQTVDKEVRKPEDMAGLKMRIPSRTGAWIIEALGANPVGMPVPSLPQALSKKVVDGALIPWEIIPPFKLHELTDYQIEGNNMTRFGTLVFQVSMNKASWNKLPADIQQAFTDNSGREYVKEVGNIWRAGDDFGIKMAVESGNHHIVLSEAETEAFRVKLEPVLDRWIREVEEKGINGKELVGAARAAVAKYSN